MSSTRTYSLVPDADLPDLARLDEVATVDNQAGSTTHETVADTPAGSLGAAGVSLRRSTGGEESGWFVQAGGVAVVRPAGRSARTVPAAVARLLTGWTGGDKLAPVADKTTRTTVLTLRDAAGDAVATVHDASTVCTEGDQRTDSRLVTVTAESAAVRKAVAGALKAAGAEKAAPEDDAAAAPAGAEVNRNSPARTLLHTQLAELVADLHVGELRVRLREDDAVHQLRITVRRIRALLAVWRPELDTEVSEPLRARLHAYGALLAPARDAEVIAERLVPLAQGEPAATRVGPVTSRVTRTLAAERKDADAAVLAELDTPAHADLLAELAAAVEEPPLADPPGPRVAKVVPRLLRRTHKRLRTRAAALTVEDVDHDTAVHDVRKAARRARYAAEAFAGQLGASGTSYAATMEDLQDVLGERQDALASCRRLQELAAAATADGQSAFTYGRLHAAEQDHVAAADAAYPKLLKKALRASPGK